MSLTPKSAGRDLYGGANALLSMPSVSGSSGSSGSGFSLSPYLQAATGLLDALDSGPFSSSISFDDDGRMQVEPTWWDENINKGRLNQLKAQAQAYNNSLDQYDQQYQLQLDAFNYNKELSNRQQDLAEESYYNGTINQAKQLAQLGINPASQGGSISGAAMSGGSSVNAGSASAGNTNTPEAGGMNLEALSILASLSSQREELDIAKYNAETSRISANASAESSLASADNIRAITDFLDANGYLPGQFTSTPEGVRTSKIFDIGNVLVAALVGYFSGRKGGKKPPRGKGSSGSGSSVPLSLPSPTGSPSSVPNPYYEDNGMYEEMDDTTYAIPETIGIGDIGRVLTEASQYRKSKQYSKFWSDVSSVLKDANLPEISLGVGFALRMLPMLFGAPIM